MTTPGPASVPRIGRGFRLQWEEAQGCHVLLYPEGMVRLNQSAGEILRRCDGARDVEAIVADLEAAFAARGLERDVLGFLEIADRQRWVEWA
ncbi:MAG: pyrroloquinoline quinone biosynthesis peptide chaperone PqqD [Rubrivivax sp.]|nr:pyrroloquinoline quinone biosynthesis peptide chaperone PqqD [Rubrivivax sp.]